MFQFFFKIAEITNIINVRGGGIFFAAYYALDWNLLPEDCKPEPLMAETRAASSKNYYAA